MNNNTQNKTLHIILVLLVFTCTGLTVAELGKLLIQWIGIPRFSFLYWAFWIVVLLPIYNVIILIYALIFGKYRYFREKQLKTWKKITGLFRSK